jgi:large repetitive protein
MSRTKATQHVLIALTTLVVALSVQAAQAQSTWIVTGNVAETSGANADIEFGVHPNGSDGLDDGTGGTVDLGETEAPLPSGAFDTRWADLSGSGFNGFRPKNVVAGTNNTTHTMQLNFTRAVGGNITVTWDMAALALATQTATISDLAGGFFGVPVQDMRTTNSVLVTNAAATSLQVVFLSNDDYTQPAPPEAEVLTFSTQPGTVTSGAAFTVVVNAKDIATSTNQVGATITLSQASGAGTLAGTLTATTDASGNATFSGLVYTAAVDGENFTIDASTSSNTPGIVISTVSAAGTADVVATRLAFTTQPAWAFNQTPMLTQPVVTAQDGSNLTDTGFTGTVALTATAVTGAGVLTGTVGVAAVAGVVTFVTAQYDVAVDGDTFSLTAASAGVTSATSNTIAGSILPVQTTLTPVGAAGENHAPLLSWGAAVTAASYELDLGLAPACTSILSAFSTTATTYQSGPLADGTYCWNVRSVNATGFVSPSATDTFVTIPTFGEWTMILLIVSMAGGGIWHLRWRKLPGLTSPCDPGSAATRA